MVTVSKPGQGGWSWDPLGLTHNGAQENAVFIPDLNNPGEGDFYMEPAGPDPAGTVYQSIEIRYATASNNQNELFHWTTTSGTGDDVNPNWRVPGKELQVDPVDPFELSDEDWTSEEVGVGPDGYEDVKIHLKNLSAGADCHVTVEALSIGKTWESGLNPNGHLNAELLNRAEPGNALGTQADLFFSTDVDLYNIPLKITVSYERSNPELPNVNFYTNREGKIDTVEYTPHLATEHTYHTAMTAVAVANLPRISATSLEQDATSPGNSYVAVTWPSGKSFTDVDSALLSNSFGTIWLYRTPPYHDPWAPSMTMGYDSTKDAFSFPPVRDEAGSNLNLLLNFHDGIQAVATFVGKSSDVGRRVADPRPGGTSTNVNSAAGLISALAVGVPNIHLQAGTYSFTQPLTIGNPVRITADAGVILTFTPSAGPNWDTTPQAILITASHVSLDGFKIRFQNTSADWKADDRVVIGTGGATACLDLSFTHLDIQAPAAAPTTTTYEAAIDLIRVKLGDSGVIADNTLRGGVTVLRSGPWEVLNNDYQGAVAHTVTSSFLAVDNQSHDLVIRGNHAHQVDSDGIAQRFIVMGNADYGQAIGNLIENNTIDGHLGMPAAAVTLPSNYTNAPEIVLEEMYQPRFEGKPSAVSPDGFVVRIPYLRGAAPRPGDVVSVVSGDDVGQWRMIVQTLNATTYLLDAPLPQGDYVIAIGRGFVNQTYRNNTFDIQDRRAGTVAFVFGGNDWGTRILDNTVKGGNSLRLGGGATEAAFPGPTYGAPRGWTHLPMFDLVVDGNTFEDAAGTLGVSHGDDAKSNSGRTYVTGDISNNEFQWSSAGTAMTIGSAGFTPTATGWVTFNEIELTMLRNWGINTSAGAAPTIQVYAARVTTATNTSNVENQNTSLPTVPTATAVARGQDGSDYAGGSSGGPDGRQDVHIVVAGLRPDEAINQVVITGYGGGQWDTSSASSPYSVVVFRHGTGADLYIQPYQNETGTRYFTVGIQYADVSGTWVYPTIDALYASVNVPALANVSTPSGTVTARGDYPGSGQVMANAFDGDVNTSWLDFSGTSWIQYQFAGGAAQVVTQYTITSAADTATYTGRAPRDWTLKGSNDGVTWTTLDVRTNEANTSNHTPRTYRFTNTTAYKYYKFDDIVSNGDPIIQIAEIQLQSPQAIALNAGGSSVSGSFQVDNYAFGGNTSSTSHAIDVSGAGAAPESVYQVERYGDSFNYQIPGFMPGGVYTVRLHFSEDTATAAGQRTFNVTINSVPVLDHFDVFAAAGGMYKAVVREFTATASASGYIVVVFDGAGAAQPGDAMVNGIEIDVPGVDLARGKSTTSSSDESATYAAGKAVDGNSSTRWSSGQWMQNNSIGWLTIDLGALYDIDRVQLNWEAAFAADYQIQVSEDGHDWTTAASPVGATTGGVVDFTNRSARGRYVRVYCTKVNSTNNYSLYDVNIYGA